jgi:hypothetical protein
MVNIKFGSEETGSLDFCLIIYYKKVLLENYYFDFGISNVGKAKKLNEGLTY